MNLLALMIAQELALVNGFQQETVYVQPVIVAEEPELQNLCVKIKVRRIKIKSYFVWLN